MTTAVPAHVNELASHHRRRVAVHAVSPRGLFGVKSLALLFFLFLVVPGSGQLVWDGLPLSTRAEVAALMTLTLAITNQRICNAVRERISRTRWRGVLTPALGVLILLKLLTFAWYPFSDGFDACYRSIYNPLENLDACEKSYEGPFLRRSDLGLSNTSRIDRTVDFGTHAHALRLSSGL